MTLRRPLALHLSGTLALAAALLAALAACASTPPPTAQMALAGAALANAQAAGSAALAPDELRLARAKMDRANAAMAAQDYDLAGSLAEQAVVDAKLAESRARAAQAQKSASALSEGSRVLREELQRKAAP